jgi:serine protease Do
MHTAWWSRPAAVVVVLTAALGGAGTEARADYNRRTAVVEAVEKTRDGIVSVKVEKSGAWGRKEVVGTGVVIDERGYVVTNRHVVAGADRVTARLPDGTEVTAQVVVEDARYDLAVLRVPADKKLQALPLGPGGDLMVGETVIAVGHPFGFTNTVSTGIISYVGREVTMPAGETLTNLIQTTASINPGNSGGPLLNINGEVIGINVALREGAQGIAFALNADTVQQVLSKHLSALKLGGVRHGLACAEAVAAEGAARQRVLVEEVADGGPAAQAGLRHGDQVLRVGGRAVANRFDVERALWDRKAGDKVELAVLREGREATVALTLGRGADPEPAPAAKTGPASARGGAATAAGSEMRMK